MALDTKALIKIGESFYGAGAVGTLWFYQTGDAAATVEAAGYFNNSRAKLKKGDVVICSMVIGGTPVLKALILTAVPASGNITSALQTTTAG